MTSDGTPASLPGGTAHTKRCRPYAAWLACIFCCLPCFTAAETTGTEVRLSGNRILYRGTITEQGNADARALYAAASPAPTILRIESQGGKARAGIELGSWVFERQLDVEVATFCFSSCANYVFTAGAHKVLATHASLLWHGGPSEPLSAPALEALLDRTLQQLPDAERQTLVGQRSRAEMLGQLQHSLQELVDLETEFFTRISVDRRITTLGQANAPAEGGPYKGWDYSLRDMAILGVHAISLEDGSTWEPIFPIIGAHIFRIDLATLPGFEPVKFDAPPSAK